MSSDGYRRFSVTILISIICRGQLWKTCNHPIMETDTETDTDSRRFRNQVELPFVTNKIANHEDKKVVISMI